MTRATRAAFAIRAARESDLDDIDEMVNDFVKGHPAETLPDPVLNKVAARARA